MPDVVTGFGDLRLWLSSADLSRVVMQGAAIPRLLTGVTNACCCFEGQTVLEKNYKTISAAAIAVAAALAGCSGWSTSPWTVCGRPQSSRT